MADKEGKYCQVCGGLVPTGGDVRKIVVDGKEIGITHLDQIFSHVLELHLANDTKIREELLTQVKAFNYVPTKKTEAYAAALMNEYEKLSRVE